MGKHDNSSQSDGHKSGGYDHSKTKKVEAGGGRHSKDDKGGK